MAEEGLATSRSLDDRWLEAIFLYVLGRIALDRGDIALAQRFNEQTLAIARELVMPDWQSFSLVKLAYVAVVGDNPGGATISVGGGGDLSSIQWPAEPLGMLRRHGCARLAPGQHEHAARLSGVASTLLGSLFSSDMLDQEIMEPYYAKSRRALGDAAYDAAWREGRALRRETAIDQALAWLAEPR